MKTVAKPIKKQSIKKLKDRVWDVFSKYIRMRDCLATTGSLEYGECFTCDEPPQHEFRKLQAGHYVAGRHNSNLFSEKGCHAQCRRCNLFLGGNPHEYRERIDAMYGEGYHEILEQEAKQIKTFTVEELEGLLEHYREQIKQLEELR